MEFKRFWHQSEKPASFGERSLAERLQRHRPQEPTFRRAEDAQEAPSNDATREPRHPPQPQRPATVAGKDEAAPPPAMSSADWNSALEGDP
jgi:hypothetical protein